MRGRFGAVKTEASGKPVSLLEPVRDALVKWRRESNHNADSDFLFPSLRLNGAKPLTPDMVLKKIIRPALDRSGVTDKVIGRNSFRHSYATNLHSLGVYKKTAQALMRHSSSRVTMDVYTHVVSDEMRRASARQFDMLMPKTIAGSEGQHPSAPMESSNVFSEAINQPFSLVYGGDDGARTRDLCRDRAAL